MAAVATLAPGTSQPPIHREPLFLRGKVIAGEADHSVYSMTINHLTPNDPYRGRTAPITSKRCILYIFSTNIGTDYFKHALYSPFFLFKMQFVS